MERFGWWRRRSDMRLVGVASLAVAAALTGCTSGTSAATAPSGSDGSSLGPAVSSASPGPSDDASLAGARAVTAMSRQLLSQIVVPAGAVAFHGKAVGQLSGPSQRPAWKSLIDVADSWKVPGTATDVIAQIQRSLPPSLTPSAESGAGSVPGDEVVIYQAPAGPDAEGATVLIEAANDPAGGVDLRVDVQDVWLPLVSAADRPPVASTGATMVLRSGLLTSPSPARSVHVSADVAQRIAGLLNALPAQPDLGGPDAGGGPDATVTVTFDGDPHSLSFVVAGGIYNTVTVNPPTGQTITLEDAGPLFTYLQSLIT